MEVDQVQIAWGASVYSNSEKVQQGKIKGWKNESQCEV